MDATGEQLKIAVVGTGYVGLATGTRLAETDNQVTCVKSTRRKSPCCSPDFPRIKSLLKNALIFDDRNQYAPATMKSLGFGYECIGRAAV